MAKMRELVLHLAFTRGLLPVVEDWQTKPLKSLATKIGSGATPEGGRESYLSKGIPLIRSMNIHFGGFDSTGLVFLSEEQANRLSNVIVQTYDVLLNITGASIGRVTTAPTEMAGARVNQHVTIIRPTKAVDSQFLAMFLASPAVQRMIDEIQVGATRQALTKGMIEEFEIPLPPLAEQKRIVAKVDELMVLCDRLEAQHRERETQQAALARAAVARFANAPTPANIELLFHKSYSVSPADLRKTILTLAVQGRLVPQDANEEPAHMALITCGVDLLEGISTEEAKRYPVPESWAWIRFAAVGDQRLGKMLDAEKNRGELKPYLRNTNVQWMRFDLDDIKKMRVEESEANELRLQKGDLLICEGGEPGRCAIWNGEMPEMYFQKALHRVRPCSAILPEYLALNLQIDCRNDVLSGYFTGATIKHLTGRSLSQYPIPIPPLAEQHRIVAKVNELMALVDKLEAQLTASRVAATTLMEAFVAELTEVRTRINSGNGAFIGKDQAEARLPRLSRLSHVLD
jgi:type I restriction enzyme S subunit